MVLETIEQREAIGVPAAERARLVGLRCRNCGLLEAFGPSYVCAACFGPLEVAYDLETITGSLDAATIDRRAHV